MGGQIEKLKEQIAKVPADFTYDELRRLLKALGFQEDNAGATSGSRVRFYRESDEKKISLHKPHPGNIVKKSTLRDVVETLREGGDLS